jgi:hypothetical protein
MKAQKANTVQRKKLNEYLRASPFQKLLFSGLITHVIFMASGVE